MLSSASPAQKSSTYDQAYLYLALFLLFLLFNFLENLIGYLLSFYQSILLRSVQQKMQILASFHTFGQISTKIIKF